MAVAKLDWIGTETTLFVLYLLTIAGGLAAAALLAHALAPGSMLAPWAAAVFFGVGVWPLIGAGTIAQQGYAEQTSLAVVLFILAFAAAMWNRPLLWAVAFGLGFLTNQGYGVHVGLYFLIWGGMRVRRRQAGAQVALRGPAGGCPGEPGADLVIHGRRRLRGCAQ